MKRFPLSLLFSFSSVCSCETRFKSSFCCCYFIVANVIYTFLLQLWFMHFLFSPVFQSFICLIIKFPLIRSTRWMCCICSHLQFASFLSLSLSLCPQPIIFCVVCVGVREFVFTHFHYSTLCLSLSLSLSLRTLALSRACEVWILLSLALFQLHVKFVINLPCGMCTGNCVLFRLNECSMGLSAKRGRGKGRGREPYKVKGVRKWSFIMQVGYIRVPCLKFRVGPFKWQKERPG